MARIDWFYNFWKRHTDTTKYKQKQGSTDKP